MLLARSRFIAAVLPLMSANTAHAQDNWLFSAKPPIVVRYDDASPYQFHFTNTSDKPIHGIKLHWTEDGKEFSWVIIDTIEPHKTELVEATTLEKCCALDK